MWHYCTFHIPLIFFIYISEVEFLLDVFFLVNRRLSKLRKRQYRPQQWPSRYSPSLCREFIAVCSSTDCQSFVV